MLSLFDGMVAIFREEFKEVSVVSFRMEIDSGSGWRRADRFFRRLSFWGSTVPVSAPADLRNLRRTGRVSYTRLLSPAPGRTFLTDRPNDGFKETSCLPALLTSSP